MLEIQGSHLKEISLCDVEQLKLNLISTELLNMTEGNWFNYKNTSLKYFLNQSKVRGIYFLQIKSTKIKAQKNYE